MKKYISYILIIIALFVIFSSVVKAQQTDTFTSNNGTCSYSVYIVQSDCVSNGGIWTPSNVVVPPTQTNTLTPITSPTPSGSQNTPPTTNPNFSGLVHCDNSAAHPCNFTALMELVNTLIQFALFALALPITAIMLAYAGFELVTSGGSTEKRGIAKKVFTSAVIGFIIAMAGWLIVKTILSIMGYNGAWIGF